jgi:hypothetical protein
MTPSRINLKKLIAQKSKPKARSYPVATIALYGPNSTFATKVAVAIFLKESSEPDVLERWFSKEEDVRLIPEVGEEVARLLAKHNIKTVGAPDRIIGCPHEEGVDYPENGTCPKCPFWAHRDRFTHDSIQ